MTSYHFPDPLTASRNTPRLPVEAVDPLSQFLFPVPPPAMTAPTGEPHFVDNNFWTPVTGDLYPMTETAPPEQNTLPPVWTYHANGAYVSTGMVQYAGWHDQQLEGPSSIPGGAVAQDTATTEQPREKRRRLTGPAEVSPNSEAPKFTTADFERYMPCCSGVKPENRKKHYRRAKHLDACEEKTPGIRCLAQHA
ncbi:hypothetical protein DENSPDRAFT_847057 [Dentipellis sp. KUC8613]|nr:hypothetical protein DENSPDRAFT_847057 [Dentipellis sp. KUC8613]